MYRSSMADTAETNEAHMKVDSIIQKYCFLFLAIVWLSPLNHQMISTRFIFHVKVASNLLMGICEALSAAPYICYAA